MKDPSSWTEADLQALVDDKVQEDLHLDYKRSAALAKTDPCRTELSKDVSAFANSDGGLIIYGIAEGKDNYPAEIDEGIDAIVLNREWLEQTVTSYIQPKIDELRIYQISLPSKGQNRIAYVISVPQAKTRAPHQARDKKYYRRYNFQSVPMEDYEIRDMFHRSSTPDLYMDFVFDTGVTTTIPTSGQIRLNARIGNRSREPALYAAITVYIEHLFTITYGEGLSHGQTVELIDGRSGEIRQAQIFVAVMGASSYTYAEASWTQTLPDWIGSHARVHAHSPAKAGPTGITAPISCHTFRATGITAYLANGGALEHAANRSLNIVGEIPDGHRWVSPPKIRFAPDSPLGEVGFEPLVPPVKRDGVFRDHPDRPPPLLLPENQARGTEVSNPLNSGRESSANRDRGDQRSPSRLRPRSGTPRTHRARQDLPPNRSSGKTRGASGKTGFERLNYQCLRDLSPDRHSAARRREDAPAA